MTVAIWAILFYPFVWLYVIFFCTVPVLCVLLLLAFMAGVLDWLLEAPQHYKCLEVLRHHMQSHTTWIIWHGFGALCLLFFLLGLLSVYSKIAQKIKPDVRWTAYVVDFQDMPRYPGLERGKRTRLHENGVVSYAEPSANGWDISISVARVSDGEAQ